MTAYAKEEDLIKILSEGFPELKVEIPTLYSGTDITEAELRNSVIGIKDTGYVEHAIRTFNDFTNLLIESITYSLVFPERKKNLKFKVDWLLGPNVLVGWIFSEEPGKKTYQARLYGIWDNRFNSMYRPGFGRK